MKWSYAGAFLMFLLGLVVQVNAFHGYTPDELLMNSLKLIWFLVFFSCLLFSRSFTVSWRGRRSLPPVRVCWQASSLTVSRRRLL